MLLDVSSILILVGIGLFAGVVNTLAGGGSLVTLPVLILFLGLDEATANGTNRLMVITAALVASYGYRSKGITTHPWGLYFGIVATFGAIIGARIAIYIDGDHSYKGVKNDLELYYPKVKKNGLILCDDYRNFQGVKKAVEEFCKKNKIDGNITKNKFYFFK